MSQGALGRSRYKERRRHRDSFQNVKQRGAMLFDRPVNLSKVCKSRVRELRSSSIIFPSTNRVTDVTDVNFT